VSTATWGLCDSSASKLVGEPEQCRGRHPSQSTFPGEPSRRGAGKPYFSATASAAAFVATWSSQIRESGAPPQMRSRQQISDLSTTGSARRAENERL
jgi:hypothetical protein